MWWPFRKGPKQYRFDIEVTQGHIDNGVAGNRNYCPVALAMRDAGLSVPVVGLKSGCAMSEVGFMGILVGLTFTWPKCLTRFVEDFDKGKNVEPFKASIFGVRPTKQSA